jgi:hypothetical protein
MGKGKDCPIKSIRGADVVVGSVDVVADDEDQRPFDGVTSIPSGNSLNEDIGLATSAARNASSLSSQSLRTFLESLSSLRDVPSGGRC